MALVDDLAFIARSANKALTVTRILAISTVVVSPGEDLDGESQLDLTPTQQATLLGRRNALVAAIKARAATLP